MKSKIILVGPTCAGKNFMRNKFIDKGYLSDVSYTTRGIRAGERSAVDYHFISREKFENMVEKGMFYEHVEYENICYGTGLEEWKTRDVFIMETDGISKIPPIDRRSCFVIFINTPKEIREERMKETRLWDADQIESRAEVDHEKFSKFEDYDMIITSNTF